MYPLLAIGLGLVVFVIVGFCAWMAPAWRIYRSHQIFILAAIITTLLYILFVDAWMAVNVALVVWLITVWVVGHLVDQIEYASI